MADNKWFLIVGVLAVALYLTGSGAVANPFAQTLAPATGTTQSGAIPAGQACFKEDISLIPNAVRAGLLGTAVGDGHRVFVMQDGGKYVDKGVIANLGSLTTSVGQKVRILFGENSTTYYSVPYGWEDYDQARDVDCSDPFSVQQELAAMAGSGGVAVPTITFFNAAGTAATVQAIAAGGKETVSFKITAPADSCISNPNTKTNPAVAMRYNSTEMLAPKVQGAKSVGNPNFVGTLQTGFRIVTWELPDKICDLPGMSREKTYLVDLEAASSTANPTDQVNTSLVDADFDLNQDTLELIDGFQDESQNNLGVTNETTFNLTIS